jgi:hypothetical protein
MQHHYRHQARHGSRASFHTLLRRPRAWPRWVRVMLILTAPVALPLWLALIILSFAGAVCLAAVRGIYRPIRRFALAPQRRISRSRSYGRYHYN